MVRRPKCRMCKRVVKVTSKQQLCAACSVRKCKLVNRQMIKRKGKYYKKYKLGLTDYVKKLPM